MTELLRAYQRERKQRKLIEKVDGNVWTCKGEGCEDCDSHPCLIERAMRERSSE